MSLSFSMLTFSIWSESKVIYFSNCQYKKSLVATALEDRGHSHHSLQATPRWPSHDLEQFLPTMPLSWPQRWTQPGNRPTATALVNKRLPHQCGRRSGGGRAARWAEQERATFRNWVHHKNQVSRGWSSSFTCPLSQLEEIIFSNLCVLCRVGFN